MSLQVTSPPPPPPPPPPVKISLKLDAGCFSSFSSLDVFKNAMGSGGKSEVISGSFTNVLVDSKKLAHDSSQLGSGRNAKWTDFNLTFSHVRSETYG